jgi:Fe2+ or Zn2+ uptake regulation protein
MNAEKMVSSPEQRVEQKPLRLNERQREVAKVLAETHNQPFEVEELRQAIPEDGLNLLYTVIDKLSRRRLIEDRDIRDLGDGRHSRGFVVPEHAQQTIENPVPTRLEKVRSAIGDIIARMG